MLEYDINRNPLGIGVERRADDARRQRAHAARAAGVLMRARSAPASRARCSSRSAARRARAACRPTRGTDAYMQVPGAQFVRGPMPAGSRAGPAVDADHPRRTTTSGRGSSNDAIGGALAPVRARPRRSGCRATWATGSSPPVRRASRRRTIRASRATRGVLHGHRAGQLHARRRAPSTTTATSGRPRRRSSWARPRRPNPPPTGDLVVTLTWDTTRTWICTSCDPTGAEIFWRRPVDAAAPDDPVDGGQLRVHRLRLERQLRHRRAATARTPSGRTRRRPASTPCESTRLALRAAGRDWNVRPCSTARRSRRRAGWPSTRTRGALTASASGVLALQFTVP